MQQVSCDCIGYHHTFIPQHHQALAFAAPAITHIIQSPSASFTAPAVSSPWQKVISLICKLYPMTKGYWWQLLPSLPNWHPHQLNARCAIYAIFASLAPPPFFFHQNPSQWRQPKGTLVIPGWISGWQHVMCCNEEDQISSTNCFCNVWDLSHVSGSASIRVIFLFGHIREIACHLSRSSTWNLFWRKLALSSPIAAFPAKHLFGQSQWKLDRV
jgi:hypothetical protein